MNVLPNFGDFVLSYRNGYGVRPKGVENGPIVLRIADVSSGEIDLSDPRRGNVSQKILETYRLSSGELLLIRVNGAREIVGRCCVVRENVPSDTIFNDHLIRVRLKEGLDPEFARYFLSAPQARNVIEEAASTSAGQLTINQQVISGLEVPDIDIGEQKKRAEKISRQFGEYDVAKEATICQLHDVAALTDAIIFDSVKNPESHPRLGAVLDEVKQGIGEDWASHPVLGATRDGLAPAKEPPGKQAHKYKPAVPGTVFYNPMRILIGSIAMVDEDDTPGITSPDYVVLRGKPGVVDSRWFYYWLRSPLGANCIQSLARGAVRERMLFNRLAEGEIALPSFADQQRASAALKELKPLKRALEARLAEINLLPQKILSAAFEM
ncbi:hypothetical protein V8J36_05150 [Frigidibacter sp. MR17.14]